MIYYNQSIKNRAKKKSTQLFLNLNNQIPSSKAASNIVKNFAYIKKFAIESKINANKTNKTVELKNSAPPLTGAQFVSRPGGGTTKVAGYNIVSNFVQHSPKNGSFSKKYLTSYSKLTEIQLVTIGLASPKRIQQWAEKTLPNGKIIGQVLNANTLHHKTFKPQKGGLFCERIFGPLKDFVCSCNKTADISVQKFLTKPNFLRKLDISATHIGENGKEIGEMSPDFNKNVISQRYFCPKCDVEYTWSVIRRYQLGYIQFICPITHVWYLKGNPSYLSILLGVKKKQLEHVNYCSETLTLEYSVKENDFWSQSLKGYSTLFGQNPTELLLSWRNLFNNVSSDSKNSPSSIIDNSTNNTKVNALIANKINKPDSINSLEASDNKNSPFSESFGFSNCIQLHKKILERKQKRLAKVIKKNLLKSKIRINSGRRKENSSSKFQNPKDSGTLVVRSNEREIQLPAAKQSGTLVVRSLERGTKLLTASQSRIKFFNKNKRFYSKTKLQNPTGSSLRTNVPNYIGEFAQLFAFYAYTQLPTFLLMNKNPRGVAHAANFIRSLVILTLGSDGALFSNFYKKIQLSIHLFFNKNILFTKMLYKKMPMYFYILTHLYLVPHKIKKILRNIHNVQTLSLTCHTDYAFGFNLNDTQLRSEKLLFLKQKISGCKAASNLVQKLCKDFINLKILKLKEKINYYVIKNQKVCYSIKVNKEPNPCTQNLDVQGQNNVSNFALTPEQVSVLQRSCCVQSTLEHAVNLSAQYNSTGESATNLNPNFTNYWFINLNKNLIPIMDLNFYTNLEHSSNQLTQTKEYLNKLIVIPTTKIALISDFARVSYNNSFLVRDDRLQKTSIPILFEPIATDAVSCLESYSSIICPFTINDFFYEKIQSFFYLYKKCLREKMHRQINEKGLSLLDLKRPNQKAFNEFVTLSGWFYKKLQIGFLKFKEETTVFQNHFLVSKETKPGRQAAWNFSCSLARARNEVTGSNAAWNEVVVCKAHRNLLLTASAVWNEIAESSGFWNLLFGSKEPRSLLLTPLGVWNEITAPFGAWNLASYKKQKDFIFLNNYNLSRQILSNIYLTKPKQYFTRSIVTSEAAIIRTKLFVPSDSETLVVRSNERGTMLLAPKQPGTLVVRSPERGTKLLTAKPSNMKWRTSVFNANALKNPTHFGTFLERTLLMNSISFTNLSRPQSQAGLKSNSKNQSLLKTNFLGIVQAFQFSPEYRFLQKLDIFYNVLNTLQDSSVQSTQQLPFVSLTTNKKTLSQKIYRQLSWFNRSRLFLPGSPSDSKKLFSQQAKVHPQHLGLGNTKVSTAAASRQNLKDKSKGSPYSLEGDKQRLVNNIYYLSHLQTWEFEKDWLFFQNFSSAYPFFTDIPISAYATRFSIDLSNKIGSTKKEGYAISGLNAPKDGVATVFESMGSSGDSHFVPESVGFSNFLLRSSKRTMTDKDCLAASFKTIINGVKLPTLQNKKHLSISNPLKSDISKFVKNVYKFNLCLDWLHIEFEKKQICNLTIEDAKKQNPILDMTIALGENLFLTASYSGAGLIQHLLKEYDLFELKKMDKQNRFLLYELNNQLFRVIQNTKLTFQEYNKLKKTKFKSQKKFIKTLNKEIKELYLIRDNVIRRAKLVRSFLKVDYLKKDSSPSSMILNVLPVLPPDLRPIVKIGGQIAASDLNRLYQRVIYRNERLKKFLKDPATSQSIEMKYAQRLLQEAVDNLIQNGKAGSVPERDSRGRTLKSLSEILKGKQGRFRQYLLGKRVDYSGRSVIVVGPKLKLHQCGIPKEMALELFLPFLLKRILSEKLARTVAGAKNLIKTNKNVVWELLREVMQVTPVLLNRAPTLHRLGFQAFQPKLVDGRAILLHPLSCPSFNADFDGDQMAVHVPITVEARAEAWKLMLSRNNLLSPATGEPIVLPSQDMVLGCYYLTILNKVKSTIEKTSPSDNLDSNYDNRLDVVSNLRLSSQNQTVNPNIDIYTLFSNKNVDLLNRWADTGLFENGWNSTLFPTSENVPIDLNSLTSDINVLNRSSIDRENAQKIASDKIFLKFNSIEAVMRAYEKQIISLHQPIWVKWNGLIEHGNNGFNFANKKHLEGTPIEIQLTPSGNWNTIYLHNIITFNGSWKNSTNVLSDTLDQTKQLTAEQANVADKSMQQTLIRSDSLEIQVKKGGFEKQATGPFLTASRANKTSYKWEEAKNPNIIQSNQLIKNLKNVYNIEFIQNSICTTPGRILFNLIIMKII